MKKKGKNSRGEQTIKPIYFDNPSGSEPYNASEVVAIGDGRFLFCDNNIGDALLELRLTPDGQIAHPLIKRPLQGLEDGVVDDIEGITLIENAGRKYIFATPSLSLKQRKKERKKRSQRGKIAESRTAFLRILLGEDGQLQAERVPDFRSWLLAHAPELHSSHKYLPDDGGLNVEGLAWDATKQLLLLGLRTPTRDGRPLVLRVRLNEPSGAWTLDNFEMLTAVVLQIKDVGEEQGIRAIEYDPSRGTFLVVVGNATSASQARFSFYTWDGNEQGLTQRFKQIRFHKKMKVEGVTHGIIAGRGAVLFVDDGGGYQVLWDDDSRLQ
jgi:hypothetical protein